MAIYYARKAGNINATDVWATTPAGVAGDFFGSFTSADTLMLNNFTVTLNVDVTVLEIRNDNANGATAGGTLSHSTSRTINANLVTGTATMLASSTVGIALVVNGNLTSSVGVVSYTGASQSVTINGNVTTGGSSNAISTTGDGTSVVVNGNLIGNSSGDCIYSSSNNFTCTVNGNITLNSSGEGIHHNNSSATSASITVTGTISSDSSSGTGIYCAGGGTGTLNIVCGAITVNSGGYGVYVGNRRVSSITVNGNVLLNTTATANGVRVGGITASGTLYIDGDITVNGNGGDGVYLQSTAPAYMTTTITGNVVANNSASSHGVVVSDASIVTIQGNVSSSSTGGNGVLIDGSVAANVTIQGTCTGGLSAGAYNNSNGSILTVNGMVYAGSAASSGPGVQANGTGAIVNIYRAEYGALGASPTTGPIRFIPSSTNSIKVYQPSGSPTTKTLVDAAAVVSADPSDVRDGVLYDDGTQEGTLVVPIASTVLNGITYDNGTTGTLIMTASDFWNTATSSLNTSGSIGLYLRSAAQQSTVDSIETKVTIVDSVVDSILVDTNSIESKVDIIDSNVDSIFTDVGNIDTIVDAIVIDTTSIESKIDIIDSNVDLVNTTLDTITTTLGTIGDNVITVNSNIDAIDDVILTIDGKADTIISDIAAVPAETWDTQTSTLNTSGSVGERVKNASTVATTGQQLTDALNSL